MLLALCCLGCDMKGMIYPAPRVEVGAPPSGFEETTLVLEDGSSIVVWRSTDDRGGPMLLFFHGNGENLETLKWSGLYDQLAAFGQPVVIDYPGYGRSGGRPSEARLKAAAEAALTAVDAESGGRPVVVIGWSLGAALAIHLAATRAAQVDALVALSPWLSLPEVASGHFPRWLVSVGLDEAYDSQTAVAAVRCPTLILHGRADRIIPAHHGETLAAGVDGARWVAVDRAGHNDLLGEAIVWREIGAFLEGLRQDGTV